MNSATTIECPVCHLVGTGTDEQGKCGNCHIGALPAASAQVGDIVRFNRCPDTTASVWDVGTVDGEHVAYVRVSGSGNVALTSDAYTIVPSPFSA
jgi:hypothetical protein